MALHLNRLHPIHRATLGSVVTGLFGQAILVVSGPLVARVLGVEGRGYFALLALFPTILAQLGHLGLPQAITYYVAAHHERAIPLVRSALAVIIVQIIVLTTIHSLILLVFLPGEPQAVRVAGLLTLAYIPASLARQYGLAVLQGQKRFTAFNLLRVPATLYAAGMVVVFLTGIGSLIVVTIIWLGANLFIGVAALVVALRRSAPVSGESPQTAAEPVPTVVEMLRFGLKGLLGSASPLENFRIDQAVVGLFLSPRALGLYVVGLAFTNLPYFIAESVGMVAYPHVAAQRDNRTARRSVWRFFWFTVAVCLPVVSVLGAIVGWLIPFFFGSAFSPAVPVTRILLLNVLCVSARRVLTDGVRGVGYPTLGTVTEIAAWVLLFAALPVLMPRWGLEGVASALTFSSALSLVLLSVAVIVVVRSGRQAKSTGVTEGVVVAQNS